MSDHPAAAHIAAHASVEHLVCRDIETYTARRDGTAATESRDTNR